MGCITKLLESGAKRVHSGSNAAFIEGGGTYKGYEYLVVLNETGYRCGYVALSNEHPLYDAKDWDDERIQALDMHGGCTFFEEQMTSFDCTDKWIGFDCAHHNDACDKISLDKYDPQSAPRDKYDYGAYGVIRTYDFVRSQCKHIIHQIAA